MKTQQRAAREQELRSLLEDPVERFVLERKFFEATRSIPPQSDSDLLAAILAHEFDRLPDRDAA